MQRGLNGALGRNVLMYVAEEYKVELVRVAPAVQQTTTVWETTENGSPVIYFLARK